MTFSMVASLVGGIGLFLLGMRLITDGLKYASAGTLKKILDQSTRTPLHGLLTGAFITALLQSSSAVTVAVIGFVNAGMMDLFQAVTLVFGSNIGTTMTGWLVAALGLKIKIKAIALPAVGIGMFMRTFFSGTRRGGMGEALAGFGLFFVGIGELTSSFSALSTTIQLEMFRGGGLLHTILYVFIGVLLTFLMQSSSASLAIALTAAIGGVIPLNTAAAMVIGANIGTTTTAVLATLDATSNAKRTAAAHVFFNIVTALVALMILPIMLSNVNAIRQHLGLDEDPGIILALFHTTFNFLGVLLFLPFTQKLVLFLNTIFRSVEEDESRPQYLDKTVLTSSTVAIQALGKELGRIGNIALRMAKGAISTEGRPGPLLTTDKLILDRLVDATAEYSNRIQRTNLPPELDHLLPNAMRISGYYSIISELALEIAEDESFLAPIADQELSTEISIYKSGVVSLLEVSDPLHESFSWLESEEALKSLENDYQQLKSRLLRAGTKGILSSRRLVNILECLSNIRRVAQQTKKAADYLTGLLSLSENAKAGAPALDQTA